MQTRLEPVMVSRNREYYPPIDYVDDKGIQWIEINRGCKRGCEFCWADPNYLTFPIPEIKSNKVQIIGENILYDPEIDRKILDLSNIKFDNKVVYYGLCNGLDYRKLTELLVSFCSEGRFGSINNKGNWRKGVSIAWDKGREQEDDIKKAINLLVDRGYQRKSIMVHVLVNWKITYDYCLYKLSKIKEWDVMIDDCTWECTKTNFLPMYWTYYDYKKFRKKCRDHNIRWSKSSCFHNITNMKTAHARRIK